MHHFSQPAIDSLEKRYRANLINSLSGYKSVNLLGTQDASGHTNLAIISSVFHIGANPPLVGLLIRPHSVPRHSLENLMTQGQYSINAVASMQIDQAHQCSARYDRSVSEFDATGLKAEYSEQLPRAPYVAGSPVQTGLSLRETQTLAINDTVLVIGEILEIRLAGDWVSQDGQIDMNAADVVAVTGLDEYHTARSLGRRPYAKSP